MTEPTRRDRFRPAELLSLSLVIALFGSLVVFLTTRDVVFALVSLGIVFILSLVTIALLVLAIKPNDDDRNDIDEQNRGR